MRSKRTKRFRSLYAALPRDVRRQADEAYHLYKRNPYHPSLHFKPIDPADPSVYSVRIGLHYRAVGVRSRDDLMVWYWIGSHAEYDNL